MSQGARCPSAASLRTGAALTQRAPNCRGERGPRGGISGGRIQQRDAPPRLAQVEFDGAGMLRMGIAQVVIGLHAHGLQAAQDRARLVQGRIVAVLEALPHPLVAAVVAGKGDAERGEQLVRGVVGGVVGPAEGGASVSGRAARGQLIGKGQKLTTIHRRRGTP